MASQYDLSTTTYSPDGKVFQTDYAQKAVDNSRWGTAWTSVIWGVLMPLLSAFDAVPLVLSVCSTAMGIKCKDGVVLVRGQWHSGAAAIGSCASSNPVLAAGCKEPCAASCVMRRLLRS